LIGKTEIIEKLIFLSSLINLVGNLISSLLKTMDIIIKKDKLKFIQMLVMQVLKIQSQMVHPQFKYLNKPKQHKIKLHNFLHLKDLFQGLKEVKHVIL